MNFLNFIESIRNYKIGFIGLGISHINIIKIFKEYGLDVYAYDKSDENYIGKEIVDELKDKGVKITIGKDWVNFIDMDIIFRTPGMNFLDPMLQKAIKQGKIVTSEMEVFFSVCPAKIIGITGSDGKTTTTTIISEILKRNNKKVHIGGNIGKPLLCDIENIKEDDICVVELSSFQLMSIRKSPHIAVITNITENHLDVHKDMNEYVFAKKNIFIHQDAFDKTVFNFEDEYTKIFEKEARSKIYYSNVNNKKANSSFCDTNGDIYYIDKDGKEYFILNKKDIKILGEHNVKNFMSTICAVFDIVKIEDIQYVMKNFSGVKHRMEFIKSINGINFYNDSIASTPTRLKAGLTLFDKKIILIAGGYDKNLSFDEVCFDIINKVKIIILIGENSRKIEKSIKENKNYDENKIKIIFANDMEKAVSIAFSNANKNDNIVLCPASASFDLYKNFEKRGEHFKSIVERLN